MNQRELFRHLVHQALMGATVGAFFMMSLLALNIHPMSDVVLRSSNPITATLILVSGVSFYFAFGAAITGFHFLITAEYNQRDGRR